MTAKQNRQVSQLSPRGRMHWGFGAFVTTGTTVEVVLPAGMKKIEAVFVFPLGTPNANEPLSVNETEANGIIAIQSITVTRAAGTTSGLKFAYLIIGT